MSNTNIEKNLRVLIVDDNHAIHADFRKILCPARERADALSDAEAVLFEAQSENTRRPKFEIDSAYQGKEGLALVEQSLKNGRPYAMAFIDVRMPPGWDGVETVSRIWEIYPDLQVVICTAYSDYSWDEMASRLNNSDQLVILKKPFDTVEVLQLANALTEKWRLQQEARLKMDQLELIVRDRTSVLRETNQKLEAEMAERLRATEALRESEERYQLLFRNNPLPMWVVDLESLAFLAANETAIRSYGYTMPEFLGMTMKQIHRMEDVPALLQRASQSALPAESVISKHRKKNGSLIDVEIIAREINFDGRPAKLVLATDITEKRKLEAQFLRAQRMEGIGTLATGMAHDLNNILAPILISAGTLRWGLSPEEMEDAVHHIEAGVKRGAEIIRQVLTFGRGVEGERVAVNPGELLQEVATIAGQTFPKDIAITLEGTDGLWPVTGDKTQIHQVLLNLCINARDAMAQGGRLALLGRNVLVDENFPVLHGPAAPGPYVAFQVTDTGSGISSSDLEQIFDPFFTTKELGKGTGLGLSTVLGIVKSHHGLVSVESELNKGTTFKVLFPASTEAVKRTLQEPKLAIPHGNGEVILIVDDEPGIISTSRRMLEMHGFKVLVAGHGQQALEIIKQYGKPIDVVVTDMMMPGMDGMGLIRALRNMNPGMRIIASSGLGNGLGGTAKAAELKALRINTFLAKPYTADKLLASLHELLLRKTEASETSIAQSFRAPALAEQS